MNFDTSDLAVDAMVKYLQKVLPGTIKVYPAPTNVSPEFPCVTVRCASINLITSDIDWSIHSKLSLELRVYTDASDQIDPVSKTAIKTARERNTEARGVVISALSIPYDTSTPPGLADLCEAGSLPHGLGAELSAMRVPGVWILSARPKDPLATMSADDNIKALITEIGVNVIAQAIEI